MKPTWKTVGSKSVAEYRGHAIECRMPSFNCPALHLFGYATERQLLNAINKRCRKDERRIDADLMADARKDA